MGGKRNKNNSNKANKKNKSKYGEHIEKSEPLSKNPLINTKKEIYNGHEINLSGSLSSNTKPKGLTNLGNTCFFNSVIQCLAQTRVLEEQLMKYNSLNANDEKLEALENNECLTNAYLKFINEFKSSNNNIIDPSSLFHKVCDKVPHFKGFHQQDSHDFLRCFLDNIKEECLKKVQNAINKKYNHNKFKVDKFTVEVKEKIKEYGIVEKHTVVDEIFGGRLITFIHCKKCDSIYHNFEPILDISLSAYDINNSMPKFPSANNKMGAKGGENHTCEKNFKPEISKKDNLAKIKSGDLDTTTANVDQKQISNLSKHQCKKNRKERKKQIKCNQNIKNLNNKNIIVEKISSKEEKVNPEIKSNSSNDYSNIPESEKNILTEKQCHDLSDDRESHVKTSHDEKSYDSIQSQTSATSFKFSSIPAQTDKELESNHLTSRENINYNTSSENNDLYTNSNILVKAISYDNIYNTQFSVDIMPENQNNLLNIIENSEIINVNSIENITEKMKNLNLKSSRDNLDTVNIDDIKNDFSFDSSPSMLDKNNNFLINQNFAKLAMKTIENNKLISKELSIERLLSEFISPEPIYSSSSKNTEASCLAYRCKTCNKDNKTNDFILTPATVSSLICIPPAILTLHIKRFKQELKSLKKLDNHVSFNQILDLTPYCSVIAKASEPRTEKFMYQLFGMIEHSGSMKGGHYVAYIKLREKKNISKFLTNNNMFNRLIELKDHLNDCGGFENNEKDAINNFNLLLNAKHSSNESSEYCKLSDLPNNLNSSSSCHNIEHNNLDNKNTTSNGYIYSPLESKEFFSISLQENDSKNQDININCVGEINENNNENNLNKNLENEQIYNRNKDELNHKYNLENGNSDNSIFHESPDLEYNTKNTLGEGTWYCCSDGSVFKVDDVSQVQAYLLFYERII